MSERHSTITMVVQIAALLLIAGSIFAQSYTGRVEVVRDNRAGCERAALRNAADVNKDRAEATANLIVASDPTQSHKTRAARGSEARTELAALVVLDGQIDRGDWALLEDKRDRQIVRYGRYVGVGHRRRWVAPFRCEVAYPSASPIKFF